MDYCNIGETVKTVFPTHNEQQNRLYGYLLACKQLNTTDFVNRYTYNGKHLYIFIDANERYTAIYDNYLISYMEKYKEDMLIDIDNFLSNIMI